MLVTMNSDAGLRVGLTHSPLRSQRLDTAYEWKMCLGDFSPNAARISSSVLPSRPLAEAKPRRSCTLSMSHTKTCGISFHALVSRDLFAMCRQLLLGYR